MVRNQFASAKVINVSFNEAFDKNVDAVSLREKRGKDIFLVKSFAQIENTLETAVLATAKVIYYLL